MYINILDFHPLCYEKGAEQVIEQKSLHTHKDGEQDQTEQN